MTGESRTPSPGVVRRGDDVEALDAYGSWLPAKAASEVEGTHQDGRKVHDFPVIWVHIIRDGHLIRPPLPWPAEDVRKVER